MEEEEEEARALLAGGPGAPSALPTLCDPGRLAHRLLVLLLMCFLGFGSYFCYDNPAALRSQFKRVVFALGGIFNAFWLMEFGRFVFGIGGESLAVAQNTYAVSWFKGKELNLVFGLQLSMARIALRAVRGDWKLAVMGGPPSPANFVELSLTQVKAACASSVMDGSDFVLWLMFISSAVRQHFAY
ncbi:major facilitator superfamily domain-containing protein 1-like isoform X2 [Equus quagga]|uniref:major facilitator superfamily domain-containing protein 1-like isoform X2 n=1 Tax=Equus quagga TaxID=89248 RepID=UPI001EE1EF9B|nr:major facilitator superfamily domain-containing protein 1-like isoform X2 [Equus quagga]